MSKFYRYRPDPDNFASVEVDNALVDELTAIYRSDDPLGARWSPPACEIVADSPRTESDFPSLSPFWRLPIVSQNAWDGLRNLVGESCEALPVNLPSRKPFYILHVMKTVDCLDLERSNVLRFSDGAIMRITQYALRPEMLDTAPIFKLPFKSGGELIVGERFRECVETKGLCGLVFKELPQV